ncbi:hypothetical protein CK203_061995 [Vitis vinifera]|uniref:Uncharacterized protein n=1 Tax=Vitis vinifera TaxID=29760 RepID=A0A438GER0_VITVI|nr:hypothetical protein CK203_061995 [Vitis vinifera]
MASCCEIGVFPSSSSPSFAVQASGRLLRLAAPAKIDSPKWPRTRGQSLHPFEPQKESAKGAESRFCSRTCTKAFAVETKSSSSEAGTTKAAGKTIFNKSPEKSPKLTPVQSPVSSPNPSPVQTPVSSPNPTPVPSRCHRRVLCQFHRRYYLRHPKKKLRSLKRHFQSPKLQLKHLWKNIQSEARACPIIPTAEEYHMEHLLAPRDFFYPRVVTNFYQTMTTKEHWTKRGVLLEALYKMSEGFFFGPHHLIMAALLYFEEKVHKKKLQRADCIPLLFPRLLCQILEHLGYPSKPQQERKRICPGQPQPAARRASPRHPPEGITLATPAIPRAPPAAPAPSQPSTSAEPRMAIPISEYRELCRALETLTASQSNLAQELAAIKACQEQMLASQAQQAAILRQLQVHFDLPQAVEPSYSTRATLSAFRVSSSRARSPS